VQKIQRQVIEARRANVVEMPSASAVDDDPRRAAQIVVSVRIVALGGNVVILPVSQWIRVMVFDSVDPVALATLILSCDVNVFAIKKEVAVPAWSGEQEGRVLRILLQHRTKEFYKRSTPHYFTAALRQYDITGKQDEKDGDECGAGGLKAKEQRTASTVHIRQGSGS
jgi:hypothetical protein